MSNIFIEYNQQAKRYEAKRAGNPVPLVTGETQKAVEDQVKVLFPHSHPDIERVEKTKVGHSPQWRKE
jgi:hypothetical protein